MGVVLRRVAVTAVVLSVAGCAFSSPSDSDVAHVEDELEVLPVGWELTGVSGDSSASEGFSRYLWISVDAAGDPSADDLRPLLEQIVDAVPSGDRYYIKIDIEVPSVDKKWPDISNEMRDLGLADVAGDHSRGEIYATRAEIVKGLESTS